MKKLKFNDNWNFSLGAGGALAALAGGEISPGMESVIIQLEAI